MNKTMSKSKTMKHTQPMNNLDQDTLKEDTFETFNKSQNSTLLKAIAGILSEVEGCTGFNAGGSVTILSDAFFAKIQPYTDYLKKRLGMNAIQGLLFSVILEEGNACDFDGMSRILGCKRVSLLGCKPEIDSLVRRHYLRFTKQGIMGEGYEVPDEVSASIQENKAYRRRHNHGLTVVKLLQMIDGCFFRLHNRDMSYNLAKENIVELMSDNPKLKLVQLVQSQFHDPSEQLLLLNFCTATALHADDDIMFRDMQFLFPDYVKYGEFRMSMMSDEHEFIKSGLIEHVSAGGFRQIDHFKMTEEGKKRLLEGVDLTLSRNEDMPDGAIKPESISPKELFYSPEVEAQVATLTRLLGQDNYRHIHERMVKRGLRSGFACLFYGAPGTGKTETARQLARMTGRIIMQVDISSIRDKYVGESEKRIQAVFDQYRTLVGNSPVTPILLFNECDAVLGKRPRNGGTNGVDRMEQSIQNIILQEMERLDGIMICTTNLATALDDAFERRFLYKVEFTAPTVEARQHIWQALIPDIKEADARLLAERYSLSGGNIENIARKANVDAILWGEDSLTLEKLEQYCSQEKIDKNNRPKIGF